MVFYLIVGDPAQFETTTAAIETITTSTPTVGVDVAPDNPVTTNTPVDPEATTPRFQNGISTSDTGQATDGSPGVMDGSIEVEGSGGLNSGAIAGIAIGFAVLLVSVGIAVPVVLVFCAKKKREGGKESFGMY